VKRVAVVVSDPSPAYKKDDACVHLAKSACKKFISRADSNDIGDKYVEISKMLTPWINYLQRCNWKSRGVRPPDLPGDRPDSPDVTAD